MRVRSEEDCYSDLLAQHGPVLPLGEAAEWRSIVLSAPRFRRKRTRLAYMASHQWIEIRTIVYRMAGSLCDDCFAQAQVVHHKNYRSLGAEHWEDLVPLCHDCHTDRHSR